MSVSPIEHDELRSVLDGTAATTGEAFFRSLVRHVADALGARYTFVTRRRRPGDTRVKTLAFWGGDRFSENFEYDTVGTACEPVLQSKVITIPQGLRDRFPSVELLQRWKAESYLGIPVPGSDGRVLGHLAALDTRPMQRQAGASWVLKICAARAGAEIERGRVEERLQRSESRYRALVEQIPVVTYVAQLDDRAEAQYVSPQIEAMTGFTPAEWLTPPSRWRLQLHPDDREAVLSELDRSLDQRSPFLCDYRLLKKDGCEIWVREHGVPLNHGSGQPGQFQGVMTDISAQKRLHQEMVRGQKLDALSVLAGGVAHEFNNLLTTVLANAGLALERVNETSPAHRRIDQIKNAALRAAKLTQSMLAFSGKGQFVIEALDLNELLREIAPLLRTLVTGGAELELNLDAETPLIEADAGQLRQAIVSLVGNASDAVEQGCGVVRLSTGSLSSGSGCLEGLEVGGAPTDGNCAFVEVSDNGTGMDEATRSKAFDPFFSTKFTGRGLGLASVQGIVRGHGGAIKLETRLGRGTSLRLLFPACEGLVVGAGIEPASAPGRLPRGKILVVDDDDGVQAVARAMLEAAGLEVLNAGGGDEGLELFKRHSEEISVVLLDMTMPRLGGDEVLEELRRVDPEACVILMSGYTEQRVRRLLGPAGPAGFLRKPFRSEELMLKLQQVVES